MCDVDQSDIVSIYGQTHQARFRLRPDLGLLIPIYSHAYTLLKCLYICKKYTVSLPQRLTWDTYYYVTGLSKVTSRGATVAVFMRH